MPSSSIIYELTGVLAHFSWLSSPSLNSEATFDIVFPIALVHASVFSLISTESIHFIIHLLPVIGTLATNMPGHGATTTSLLTILTLTRIFLVSKILFDPLELIVPVDVIANHKTIRIGELFWLDVSEVD